MIELSLVVTSGDDVVVSSEMCEGAYRLLDGRRLVDARGLERLSIRRVRRFPRPLWELSRLDATCGSIEAGSWLRTWYTLSPASAPRVRLSLPLFSAHGSCMADGEVAGRVRIVRENAWLASLERETDELVALLACVLLARWRSV